MDQACACDTRSVLTREHFCSRMSRWLLRLQRWRRYWHWLRVSSFVWSLWTMTITFDQLYGLITDTVDRPAWENNHFHGAEDWGYWKWPIKGGETSATAEMLPCEDAFLLADTFLCTLITCTCPFSCEHHLRLGIQGLIWTYQFSHEHSVAERTQCRFDKAWCWNQNQIIENGMPSYFWLVHLHPRHFKISMCVIAVFVSLSSLHGI